MTRFTHASTDWSYSDAELATLNEAYEHIMRNVDPDFEADTHAVSDSLFNAWSDDATVEDLVRIVGPRFA